MNAIPQRTKQPASGRRERGFTFLMVVAVMLVATIMISYGLQRSSTRHAIVSRQLDSYRRYHELRGVRDMLKLWLSDPLVQESLLLFSLSDEPAHRVTLPSGIVVRVRVRDGQGAILTRLDETDDPEARRWLLNVMRRLPADRLELTRRSGPVQVSLFGLSEEVIHAIAGENSNIADGLADAQVRTIADRDTFIRHLKGYRIDDDEIAELAKYVVFQPVMWRLEAEVIDGEATRRYEMLVELAANEVRLQEWRSIPG